jgi:hypothetical protein
MALSARALLPTPNWLRLLIVPALVFIAMATDRNYLADFWHHLARGRAMVDAGELVDRDLFTFTVPGQDFQDVNWLSQICYFTLYERGGLELVRIMNALTLALTFAWLVLLCRRLSGSTGLAAILGVGVFFGLWQVLTIRPQTFSLLLFVALFDVLERSERRPGLLAVPPFLLALWANVHGAFPAGLMLAGCFLAGAAWAETARAKGEGRGLIPALAQSLCGRTFRPWLLCFLASVLGTLVNPYGLKIYGYVGLTSNRAAVRRIDEWVPPTLDLWMGKAWLVSLLVLAAIIVAHRRIRRRWPAPRDVFLVLCFLPLACCSVRMVAWWLLVLAPLAATLLPGLLPALKKKGNDRQPSLIAGLVLAVFLFFVATSLPGLQPLNPLLSSKGNERVEQVLDAVQTRLADHSATGKVFSRFEWGEYLTWAWSPRYQVFMDGRIEIYPDSVWLDYAAITQGHPGWDEILDKYQVDALLLDVHYHSRTGLLPQVEQSRHWRRAFQVGSALVYVRPSADLARAQ